MHSTRLKGCAIALAATLSMPAFSQGTTGSGSSGQAGTSATSADTTVRRDSDRGFDWGWLGLIGLAGLAGLRRRPDTTRIDTTRTAAQR